MVEKKRKKHVQMLYHLVHYVVDNGSVSMLTGGNKTSTSAIVFQKYK